MFKINEKNENDVNKHNKINTKEKAFFKKDSFQSALNKNVADMNSHQEFMPDFFFSSDSFLGNAVPYFSDYFRYS